MIVRYEPLAALGRVHAGLCEGLAWFALESFERAHRMNMDAFEAVWEWRIAEAKLAAGITASPIRSGASAAALLEHWTRMSDTTAHLCQEFWRLTAEYADDLNITAPAAADAPTSDAPARADWARARKATEGALANAA